MPRFTPEYLAYIKSPEWEHKRQRVFTVRGRYCERCGTSKGPLQVHHLTYARLGHEALEDLQILCVPCHEIVEAGKRSSRYNREFNSVTYSPGWKGIWEQVFHQVTGMKWPR